MAVPPTAEIHPPTDGVLNVHLAEYEALMTRNSYLLQIQYAFWPVGVVVLAISAQVWTSAWGQTHGWPVGWATFLSLIIINVVWGKTLTELFQNVTYIERILRGRVASTVGSQDFWLFEPYLYGRRSHRPMFDELIAPLIASVLYVAMVYNDRPLTKLDWAVDAGVLASIGYLWLIWLGVYRSRLALVSDEHLVRMASH